jgi:hypothetical protein
VALPFLDACTDTNGVAIATHNARWSVNIGNFAIQTNQLAANGATSTTQSMAHYDPTIDGDTISPDQYFQWVIGSVAAVLNANIGGGVRIATDGSANGYGLYYSEDSNDSTMFKNVAGVLTQLGAVFTAVRVANDVCRLEVTGSTLTYRVNGTSQGTRSDSAFATGSFGPVGEGNTVGHTIDSLEGGNLAAAAVSDTLPKAQFPRSRLLFPARPFGPTNPLVEMKWNDFGAGTAVPVNTPIGLDVASTFTPSLAESETYGISIAALSSFVAGLARTAAYQRALSVASGWAIGLSRGLSYLRTLSVSGTWTPTVGRGVSYLRSLAVSSTFTPAITRARAVTLAVASTFTAALSRAVAYGRALSVASTFVASLSRQAARAKTLAVGSTFGVAIARQLSYLKTLSVSSAMTAAITRARGYARALGATSVFVPVISTRYIVGKVMAVSSTFVAAIARRLGFARSLAVSSAFTPAINRSVIHRITMAVGSVFSAALQWLLSQFGHDTSALTGKVRAYPRLTGVAASYPRLAGKPRAYPRLAGTAVGYARLQGEVDAMPRLEGVVRIYPKAA